MVELDPNAFLFSGNQVYVAELYERYLDDSHSVDSHWQEFFAELADEPEQLSVERRGASWARSDAGIVGRGALSTLSEQMTRDSALIQLEKKIVSTAELLEEKQYVIGKWQLDEAEFDRIMLLPPVSHYEYPVKGEPIIDLFWAKLARPIIFLFSCSLIILRRFQGARG